MSLSKTVVFWKKLILNEEVETAEQDYSKKIKHLKENDTIFTVTN
ncbi:hypothetical protein [Paenibacillus selenitireducens]|nr:hypothetical protein [Paenibacillus selenitireducens]